MAVLEFLGSQPGRIVRIAAGLALIATGAMRRGGWLVLAAVGLVPLAAGVFDLCILGPLFRLPVVGPKFRQAMATGDPPTAGGRSPSVLDPSPPRRSVTLTLAGAPVPVIGRARVYVCGITPYDTTHVGHAATFVWSDVAVRLLGHLGADVEVARNITDVDDVLVAEAGRRGEAWRSLAVQQTYRFEDDIARLGVLRPAHEPRAADHIGHVIDLAGALVDLGHCYERRGWVFFRGDDIVERSGLAPDQARGLLAAVDPSHHGDLADGEFDVAVWQSSGAEEPGWASPWGRGRPGWHAECAAMALVTLGAGIDLHCGGSDLAFPHHAYEAALAEAVTGVRPFARAWLRPGSVVHDGQKMAKSTGNLVFVHDPLERWSAAELRLAILDRPWAQDWEFDETTMASTRDRLRALRAASQAHDGQEGVDAVVERLSSDLDVRAALAIAEELGGGAASTVIDVLGLHHHESVRRSAVVPAP